jgi:hypothetical protein
MHDVYFLKGTCTLVGLGVAHLTSAFNVARCVPWHFEWLLRQIVPRSSYLHHHNDKHEHCSSCGISCIGDTLSRCHVKSLRKVGPCTPPAPRTVIRGETTLQHLCIGHVAARIRRSSEEAQKPSGHRHSIPIVTHRPRETRGAEQKLTRVEQHDLCRDRAGESKGNTQLSVLAGGNGVFE